MASSYKDRKVALIIKEITIVKGQSTYDISGIDVSVAKYFYRLEQENFKDLAVGDYTITGANPNYQLVLTNDTIRDTAEAIQICQIYDTLSSKYITSFEPDINTLVARYNEAVDDIHRLWTYTRVNAVVADDTTIPLVLPQLGEGEIWVRSGDGYVGVTLTDAEQLIWDRITDYTNKKKDELDAHTEIKKIDITNWTNIKITDITNHTNTMITNITNHTNDKKDELDAYTEIKKTEITDHTNIKITEITTHATNMKDDITSHTNQEIERIGEYVQDQIANLKGVGIKSIVPNGQDSQGGNVYRITLDDNSWYDFTAPKGLKGDEGTKLSAIEAWGQDANGGNIYKMYWTDGYQFDFIAPKGSKGERGATGERGRDNQLQIGSVTETSTPSANIHGTYPIQTLDLGLPRGVGISSTEFVREETDKVIYKFVYDDGTEFEWYTWKGEAGAIPEAGLAGDIKWNIGLVKGKESENWLTLDNYRPISVYDYPELIHKFTGTFFAWERVNPLTFDKTTTDFNVTIYEFGMQDVTLKTEIPMPSLLPSVMNGNSHLPVEIVPPHADTEPSVQPRDSVINFIFAGTIVDDILASNKKIMCILDIDFIAFDKINNQQIYVQPNATTMSSGMARNQALKFECGYGYANDLMIPSQNLLTYCLGGISYNTMQWGEGNLDELSDEYTSSQNKAEYIGIKIRVSGAVRSVVIKKMDLWIENSVDTQVWNIAPNILGQQYGNLFGRENTQAGYDTFIKQWNNQKMMLYLGKKS